jgi:hypothetical protein
MVVDGAAAQGRHRPGAPAVPPQHAARVRRLAELYYAYWGEFLHLAVFEPGDDPADVAGAYQRMHERYLEAIGGPAARRILDVACGGAGGAARDRGPTGKR